MNFEHIANQLTEAQNALSIEEQLIAKERLFFDQIIQVCDYDYALNCLYKAERLPEDQHEAFVMLAYLLSCEARTADEYQAGKKYLRDLVDGVCDFNLNQADATGRNIDESWFE